MILEQLIMKINGSAEIRNTRGVKKKNDRLLKSSGKNL